MTLDDWDDGVRAAKAALDQAAAARIAANTAWSTARREVNRQLVRRGTEIAKAVLGRRVVARDPPNVTSGRMKRGTLAIYDPEAGVPSPFSGGVGDLVVLSDSGKKSQIYRPDVFELVDEGAAK